MINYATDINPIVTALREAQFLIHFILKREEAQCGPPVEVLPDVFFTSALRPIQFQDLSACLATIELLQRTLTAHFDD